MDIVNSLDWNKNIADLPGAHILQTAQWGKVKEAYGWSVLPQTWHDNNQLVAAAQVLQRIVQIRGFAARLCILYVPRGPLLDWNNQYTRNRVLDDLQTLARQKRAIFIKIDPELISGKGIPGSPDAIETEYGQDTISEMKERGWQYSNDQIQFKNTVWLDLNASEDELLKRMKQKTRYNIHLAQRKGVQIRTGNQKDFSLLYKMYAETSIRDGFVIRPESYYQTVWDTFMRQQMAIPLIAEVENEPIAGLFLFYHAKKAWYLYGMSREAHRDKMPNYLLQWDAMCRLKALGCTFYDLWGAPDIFDESDSMWGVFRFKEGLGGNVIRTIGAWDFTTKPFLYKLYTQILPNILKMMRRRGKERTRQQLSI